MHQAGRLRPRSANDLLAPGKGKGPLGLVDSFGGLESRAGDDGNGDDDDGGASSFHTGDDQDDLLPADTKGRSPALSLTLLALPFGKHKNTGG